MSLKSLKIGPFVVMGTFMLIGNLITAISIIFLKDLNPSVFATITFGIYILSLYGVTTEALSRWIAIQLSQKTKKEYPAFLVSVHKSFTPTFVFLFTLTTLFLIILFPKYVTMLILCNSIVLILYIYMFFLAWLNALEKYFILALLLLPFPLARLVAGVFFVSNTNYISMFWGLLITVILMTILLAYYLFKINHNIKFNSKQFEKIKTANILKNTLILLAINVFWVADGIALKQILSDNIYNSYVLYAYFFKFAFFASSSFATVIIGRNISQKKDLSTFYRTLSTGIVLSIAAYSLLILIEVLKEGLFLELLGYSKYMVEGLGIIFGLAWLVQTIMFLLYTAITKLKNNNLITELQIGSYAITYILVVILFKSSLLTLTWAIFFHGAIFLILALLLQHSLILEQKD